MCIRDRHRTSSTDKAAGARCAAGHRTGARRGGRSPAAAPASMVLLLLGRRRSLAGGGGGVIGGRRGGGARGRGGRGRGHVVLADHDVESGLGVRIPLRPGIILGLLENRRLDLVLHLFERSLVSLGY